MKNDISRNYDIGLSNSTEGRMLISVINQYCEREKVTVSCKDVYHRLHDVP